MRMRVTMSVWLTVLLLFIAWPVLRGELVGEAVYVPHIHPFVDLLEGLVGLCSLDLG